MRCRVALPVITAILIGTHSVAQGTPITYDFTGILTQPMNGTDQFSGSFTFNADPTAANVGGLGLDANGTSLSFTPAALDPGVPIAEYGSEVSLTVKIGGQVIQYTNTAQNPTLASLTAGRAVVDDPFYRYIDTVAIQGMGTTKNPNNSYTNGSFSLVFQGSGDPIFGNVSRQQVANLQAFPFSADSLKGMSAADASGNNYTGFLTSIEMVSAPEPSGLAIFAILAMAGCAGRHLSRIGTDRRD